MVKAFGESDDVGCYDKFVLLVPSAGHELVGGDETEDVEVEQRELRR